MLEHVPAWLGQLMTNFRAGHEKLVVVQPGITLAEARIDLKSPAFADRGTLPVRYTADGPGVSPPLYWDDVPLGTQSLVLIVEDPDAPAPKPLVHAMVWRMPPDQRQLAEGAISRDNDGTATGDVGRNSYMSEGWLPPDPPTGHGVHDYVFQLFSLDITPDLDPNPGRASIVKAMAGHVLGTGLLVGTYARNVAQKRSATDQIAEAAAPH